MQLISLIGEQPIPNLLPIRYLQPESTLLVYTRKTETVARRLQRVISDPANVVDEFEALPYNFDTTLRKLGAHISAYPDVVFNLTGGTKMMALAAYALAAQRSSPFFYMQSEGQKNLLYRYEFSEGMPVLMTRDKLPSLITVEEYLNAHLPGFNEEGFSRDEHGNLTSGGSFEKVVYGALKSRFDEVLAGVRPAGVARQIEIDLVIRQGNQVGIAEVKLGGGDSGKRGLDQLKMAGEPSYLGTYTTQFLIVARRRLSTKIETLAHKRGIKIIYLDEYQTNRPLNRRVAEKLAREVSGYLSGTT